MGKARNLYSKKNSGWDKAGNSMSASRHVANKMESCKLQRALTQLPLLELGWGSPATPPSLGLIDSTLVLEALQARLLHPITFTLSHQPNITTISNQHLLRLQSPQTSTMPSIGPQLPPHLQKRKRTPEGDDTPQTAPPPKATRRANDDEIALDSDSSDDGYGPSAPKAPSTSKPTIGPSLPPSATRPSQPIGPSLPPSSASNDPSNTAPRRVLGAAPPPAPLSQRPPGSPSPPSDHDSSSEDDYGPALPSTNPSSRNTSHLPSRRPPTPPPAAPKRDDWMLAPPTAPSSRTVPDPTKLKPRKFASSSKAPSSGSGVSSIWTETPEEKARRLANAVLGREDPSTNPAAGAVTAGGGGKGGMVSFQRTAADEEKIRAYAEQTRGRSLVEEFAKAKKEGKREKDGGGKGEGGKKEGEDGDDDPSKRAFDWEKDMKVGGQISNSQRQQLLNRAANFGGRFQKGSFL